MGCTVVASTTGCVTFCWGRFTGPCSVEELLRPALSPFAKPLCMTVLLELDELLSFGLWPRFSRFSKSTSLAATVVLNAALAKYRASC